MPSNLDSEAIIQKVIKKHIDPDESFIFLFGSRATGHARPASDYDVGILSSRTIPLKTIAIIEDELEDYPIPVDVEIIDFSTVSDEFKKLAGKGIKIWNKPKKGLKRKLPF